MILPSVKWYCTFLYSSYGVFWHTLVLQWYKFFDTYILWSFTFIESCDVIYIDFFALVLAFQHSTGEHCLQLLGLKTYNVTWNRFPIRNMLIDSNSSPVKWLVTWIQICESLNHRWKMKAEPIRLMTWKLNSKPGAFNQIFHQNMLPSCFPNSSFLPAKEAEA